jgi:hypothetical protein
MNVGMCRDEVILNIVTRITLPPAIMMVSVCSCLCFGDWRRCRSGFRSRWRGWCGVISALWSLVSEWVWDLQNWMMGEYIILSEKYVCNMSHNAMQLLIPSNVPGVDVDAGQFEVWRGSAIFPRWMFSSVFLPWTTRSRRQLCKI